VLPCCGPPLLFLALTPRVVHSAPIPTCVVPRALKLDVAARTGHSTPLRTDRRHGRHTLTKKKVSSFSHNKPDARVSDQDILRQGRTVKHHDQLCRTLPMGHWTVDFQNTFPYQGPRHWMRSSRHFTSCPTHPHHTLPPRYTCHHTPFHYYPSHHFPTTQLPPHIHICCPCHTPHLHTHTRSLRTHHTYSVPARHHRLPHPTPAHYLPAPPHHHPFPPPCHHLHTTLCTHCLVSRTSPAHTHTRLPLRACSLGLPLLPPGAPAICTSCSSPSLPPPPARTALSLCTLLTAATCATAHHLRAAHLLPSRPSWHYLCAMPATRTPARLRAAAAGHCIAFALRAHHPHCVLFTYLATPPGTHQSTAALPTHYLCNLPWDKPWDLPRCRTTSTGPLGPWVSSFPPTLPHTGRLFTYTHYHTLPTQGCSSLC